MERKQRMFPILGDEIIKAIPWSVILPHEEQAKRNHGGQSLERLAQRGGLGIDEAFYILQDKPFGWNENRLPSRLRIALMQMVALEAKP